MAHTNGRIYDFGSRMWRQQEEIEILKLQLKAALGQRDEIHKEFMNVIKAIEKWGEVTLTCELSQKTITLVQKAGEG